MILRCQHRDTFPPYDDCQCQVCYLARLLSRIEYEAHESLPANIDSGQDDDRDASTMLEDGGNAEATLLWIRDKIREVLDSKP